VAPALLSGIAGQGRIWAGEVEARWQLGLRLNLLVAFDNIVARTSVEPRLFINYDNRAKLIEFE
jgi:hypothetical protein